MNDLFLKTCVIDPDQKDFFGYGNLHERHFVLMTTHKYWFGFSIKAHHSMMIDFNKSLNKVLRIVNHNSLSFERTQRQLVDFLVCDGNPIIEMMTLHYTHLLFT